MSDEPAKGDGKARTDEDTRTHLVRHLRDSGVALAAIAAVLYLASHMYGTEYLHVYRVGAGLHGFGLAHLAMIPLTGYFLVGWFGFVVYKTFTSERKLWLFVGNLTLLAAVLIRALYALAYQGGCDPDHATGRTSLRCFAA